VLQCRSILQRSGATARHRWRCLVEVIVSLARLSQRGLTFERGPRGAADCWRRCVVVVHGGGPVVPVSDWRLDKRTKTSRE
jgi:hypothetical protein